MEQHREHPFHGTADDGPIERQQDVPTALVTAELLGETTVEERFLAAPVRVDGITEWAGTFGLLAHCAPHP